MAIEAIEALWARDNWYNWGNRRAKGASPLYASSQKWISSSLPMARRINGKKLEKVMWNEFWWFPVQKGHDKFPVHQSQVLAISLKPIFTLNKCIPYKDSCFPWNLHTTYQAKQCFSSQTKSTLRLTLWTGNHIPANQVILPTFPTAFQKKILINFSILFLTPTGVFRTIVNLPPLDIRAFFHFLQSLSNIFQHWNPKSTLWGSHLKDGPSI